MTRILPTILLLLAATPAFALKSDRDKPMDVQAENFESTIGEGEAGETTLSGDVVITQGSIEVKSDKAVIHRAKNAEIERAVLTGRPATLKQALDEGGAMNARAREIDYDLQRDLVVLTGDVVIKQPEGEMRGDKVTYELTSGKVTGSGAGQSGRVKMRINPRTDTSKQ